MRALQATSSSSASAGETAAAISSSQRTSDSTLATNRESIAVERVHRLRVGHGGNCSSVGSVIDTLFLSAAVGGALFAAACAAMRSEAIVIVGSDRFEPRNNEDETRDAGAESPGDDGGRKE